MEYLFGGYHCTAKNNSIELSSEHSSILGSECIITKGFDGCLYLYSVAEWKAFAGRLSSVPDNTEGRSIKRYFFSNAQGCAIQNNRLILPEIYALYLGQNIFVAGVCNKLELWRKEDYKDIDISNMNFDLCDFNI